MTTLRPILLVVGVVVLAGALAWGAYKSAAAARAERAAGRVVELVHDNEGGSCPVIEFRSSDHGLTRIQGSVFSTPSAFQVGESVTVLYEPGNPEGATIDSITEKWFGPGLVGFFGVVMLLVGLGRTDLVRVSTSPSRWK